MVDITKTLEAKSDQMNADDLMGGSLTIKVAKVDVDLNREMPVWIHYEGDNGKPFKPCKTIRRVIAGAWGKESESYVGRSMTLYRDPEVIYAGQEVGGIRISHMSDIGTKKTFALTAKRGGKKNTVVIEPLGEIAKANPEIVKAGVAASLGGVEAYTAWLASLAPADKQSIKQYHKEWSRVAKEADVIVLEDEEPEL